MLVTFRVKDIETRLNSKPAQICPPELAALMRRLHTADSDDRAHVLRSDAAQRSDLIARR